jgi:hypothetical protein
VSAEAQTATPADLRKFAESHQKHLQRHRDALHAFRIRLGGSRLPANLRDEAERICRSADSVAAEAHAIAAGMKVTKKTREGANP